MSSAEDSTPAVSLPKPDRRDANAYRQWRVLDFACRFSGVDAALSVIRSKWERCPHADDEETGPCDGPRVAEHYGTLESLCERCQRNVERYQQSKILRAKRSSLKRSLVLAVRRYRETVEGRA